MNISNFNCKFYFIYISHVISQVSGGCCSYLFAGYQRSVRSNIILYSVPLYKALVLGSVLFDMDTSLVCSLHQCNLTFLWQSENISDPGTAICFCQPLLKMSMGTVGCKQTLYTKYISFLMVSKRQDLRVFVRT